MQTISAPIDKFVAAFYHVYTSVKYNLHFLLVILVVLWSIQLLNASSGYRLNHLGIYPRRLECLPGIFTAPFLHGSYSHLFLNSIPLIILAALVLVNGKSVFFNATLLIMSVSGFATWMMGRPGFHVGSSSLVLGYWGFLLFNAYMTRSPTALFLAFLCLYYFAGLALSLFPQEEGISWEGHLSGFLAGVLASYWFH